MKKITKECIS